MIDGVYGVNFFDLLSIFASNGFLHISSTVLNASKTSDMEYKSKLSISSDSKCKSSSNFLLSSKDGCNFGDRMVCGKSICGRLFSVIKSSHSQFI
jgi:hypothetical protein